MLETKQLTNMVETQADMMKTLIDYNTAFMIGFIETCNYSMSTDAYKSFMDPVKRKYKKAKSHK